MTTAYLLSALAIAAMPAVMMVALMVRDARPRAATPDKDPDHDR